MPELILEIGGRVFEVACEPGQEPSLERAAPAARHRGGADRRRRSADREADAAARRA